MSAAKKAGLSCPVCGGVFDADELPTHVNLHFDDDNVRKCDHPGCCAVLDDTHFEDHMLAHHLGEDNTEDKLNDSALARIIQEQDMTDPCTDSTDKLNDSALARIIQEEQDIPGPSCDKSDEELARQLQMNDNKKIEEESFKELQETYGMTGKKDGFVKQFEKEMNRKVGGQFSVADYYEMKSNMHGSLMSGYDNDNTRTSSGLIKRFQSACGTHAGCTNYFSTETDHFSVDIGDKGWGCGYRNLQMLLSALLHDASYRKHLSCLDNKIPSIPRLQSLIENSWKDGYDVAGCQQLGGSLQGSRKWIGTTEVAAVLRWLKVKARVIDFHKPTGQDGLHPVLFNWIHDYYKTRKDSADAPPAFPLYTQHQGHSRLCVGCEVTASQSDFPIKLIMFDPGVSKVKMNSLTKTKDFNNQSKFMKKTIKQMKHEQFQLLYVDGIYSDDAEIEVSKVIRSVRIPP